jgi:hypothetical protein
MTDLSAFYAQNAGQAEPEGFVVSDRFIVKDEKGKPVLDEKGKPRPIEWQLRTMTESENEEIRQSATKRVQVKKGVTAPETNPAEYIAKLVVASVVHPNLKDAELQKSYGVLGAEKLVRKMLLPGEYSALAEKVQQIQGYDKDMNELVDEVKN